MLSAVGLDMSDLTSVRDSMTILGAVEFTRTIAACMGAGGYVLLLPVEYIRVDDAKTIEFRFVSSVRSRH